MAAGFGIGAGLTLDEYALWLHLEDVLSALAVLALAVIAVLKGKVHLGVVGVLFPPAAIVAATRLATPGSSWARRRYAAGGRKLERATRRFERHQRRYRRFQERLAGAPSRPPGSESEPGPGSPV